MFWCVRKSITQYLKTTIPVSKYSDLLLIPLSHVFTKSEAVMHGENTIKLEASLVSIKPLPFLKIVTQAHL